MAEKFLEFLTEFEKVLGKKMQDDDGRNVREVDDHKFLYEYAERFPSTVEDLELRSPQKQADLRKLMKESWETVDDVIDARDQKSTA